MTTPQTRSQFQPAVFEMTIDVVTVLPNGRVVVGGRVAQGEIRPGCDLLLRSSGDVFMVRVVFLEAFHNSPEVGYAGDNVTACIEGVSIQNVGIGSRVAGLS